MHLRFSLGSSDYLICSSDPCSLTKYSRQAFAFVSTAVRILSGKNVAWSRCLQVFLLFLFFSSSAFRVCGLTFGSLIHFELTFVTGKEWGMGQVSGLRIWKSSSRTLSPKSQSFPWSLFCHLCLEPVTCRNLSYFFDLCSIALGCFCFYVHACVCQVWFCHMCWNLN